MFRFVLNFGNDVFKAAADSLDRSGKYSDSTGGGKDDTVCYKVTSSLTEIAYLKTFTYGDMNNNEWSFPKAYSNRLDGSYSYDYLTTLYCQDHGGVEASMTIKPIYKDYVVPYYQSLNSDPSTIQTSDIDYGKNKGSSYTIVFYGYSKFKPDALAAQAATSPRTSYVEEERAYRQFVYENYLQVPQSTRTYMDNVISSKNWTKGTSGIYDAIAKYISKAADYSLDYDRAMNNESDVIVAFLTKYKTGICQHYANSAVMLYRSLGIPARRVDGFCAETKKNEEVEVKAGSAHAWVEVYVDGVGWAPIDPTGSTPNSKDTSTDITPMDSLVPQDGDGKYNAFGTDIEGMLLDSRNGEFLSGAIIDKLNEMGGYYTAKVTGSATVEDGQVSFSKASGSDAMGQMGKTHISEFHMYDANGNEITDSFDFNLTDGEFKQVFSLIQIKTESKSKKHDGTPLTGKGTSVEILSTINPAHTIKAVELDASITDYGYARNSVKVTVIDSFGNDISDCYGVDSTYLGWLHVYEYKIHISSVTTNITYTGKNVANDDYTINGTRPSTDKIELSFAKLKDVGTYVNYYTVDITRDGKDVRYLYDIDYNFGSITIDPMSVTIYTQGAMKPYDGDPLTNHNYEIYGLTLEGATVELEMPASITEKGSTDNYVEAVVIKDAQGNDITKNFLITTYYGTLRIT